MIGLVIVTHGKLATEFRHALEHVVGPQDQLEVVCIEAHDDMELRRQDIEKAVLAVDTGDGVALLTDLFGGTPSNMAISLMPNANVEVIAGINLPLLVKLASVRKTCGLEESAKEAQASGRKYIQVASALLSGVPDD